MIGEEHVRITRHLTGVTPPVAACFFFIVDRVAAHDKNCIYLRPPPSLFGSPPDHTTSRSARHTRPGGTGTLASDISSITNCLQANILPGTSFGGTTSTRLGSRFHGTVTPYDPLELIYDSFISVTKRGGGLTQRKRWLRFFFIGTVPLLPHRLAGFTLSDPAIDILSLEGRPTACMRSTVAAGMLYGYFVRVFFGAGIFPGAPGIYTN